MWLILLPLVALALLGHMALCAWLFNRVHATAWPHRLIQAISAPVQAATFVVPLGLGLWTAWFAPRPLLIGDHGWLLSPLGYLPVCWLSGLIAIAIWGYRRTWGQTPQALVSNHTSVVTLPPDLAGDLVTSAMVRIPGNQVLQLHIHRKTLEILRLSPRLDGLSIVHLSDFHFTGQLSERFYQRVVDQANQLDADLVAITGDIVDKVRCIDWIPRTLGRLRARCGVYFVLGNHDLRVRDLQRLRCTLTDCGLMDLSGRWTIQSIRGAPVVLAGNELPWIPPAADLTDCPADWDGQRPLRIALCHTPDQIDWARSADIDLMLAGHTHGGQICPPFVGPVVSPSRRGVRKISGAYLEGSTLLHISRGISGTRQLRINCPPELTELILKPSGFAGSDADGAGRAEPNRGATRP